MTDRVDADKVEAVAQIDRACDLCIDDFNGGEVRARSAVGEGAVYLRVPDEHVLRLRRYGDVALYTVLVRKLTVYVDVIRDGDVTLVDIVKKDDSLPGHGASGGGGGIGLGKGAVLRRNDAGDVLHSYLPQAGKVLVLGLIALRHVVDGRGGVEAGVRLIYGDGAGGGAGYE